MQIPKLSLLKYKKNPWNWTHQSLLNLIFSLWPSCFIYFLQVFVFQRSGTTNAKWRELELPISVTLSYACHTRGFWIPSLTNNIIHGTVLIQNQSRKLSTFRVLYCEKSCFYKKKGQDPGLFLVSLLIAESTDNTNKRNYMLISFVLFQRSVASRHIEDCVKQVSEKKWRSRFNKKRINCLRQHQAEFFPVWLTYLLISHSITTVSS